MFPLDGGRLIRLNKDGTNGEIIQSKKPKITFGTSVVHDHYIKDVDPAKEVVCEISTDDYGRVLIHNKSPNEILLNGKPVTTIRPLLSNSIIKVCDGVEFRWTYKSAKENISAENNDADFASWSDPAKKHMKQSKLQKQRLKGRLTEHPIHLYSSVIDDIGEKRELSAISDDEPDTGCSAFPNDTPTQSNNLQSVSEIDESAALINFSMTENAQKEIEMQPTTIDDTDNDEPIECSGVKQEYSVTVKTQPSDCSVITLSSEESDVVVVHDISNQKDDELSIACPPSELPDDLFENDSSNDKMDDQNKQEDDVVKSEMNMNESVCSMQDINRTNTTNNSIVDFASNDDSIIPETQDILSQDESVASLHHSQSNIGSRFHGLEQSQSNLSVVSVSSDDDTQIQTSNATINLDENQPKIDVKLEASTATDGELVHQNQLNAEFNESEKLFSQDLIDDAVNDSILDTKEQNFGNGIESTIMIPNDTQPITIQIRNMESAQTDNMTNNIADSTTCISSLAINSHEHIDDETDYELSGAQQTVIENVASTNADSNTPNHSTAVSIEDILTCTNSNQECHREEQQIVPNNANDDDEMIGSTQDDPESYDDNGCIPTATSSSISISDNNAVPKLNDTTQDLNLDAFNSDLEEMDKLEFGSTSDSPASTDSGDSGNITANTSCAITAENTSANRSADTCQTTNSSTMKSDHDANLTDKHLGLMGDDINYEMGVTSTALEMDTILELDAITKMSAKDEQCVSSEIELNSSNHTKPSSTSQDSFVQYNETADTNRTLELSSSCVVSSAGSLMLKSQDDISMSDCLAQENVVSTSNNGLVAEPSNDYVESVKSIHSMATCSTPAKAIGKFDTCHSLNRSMQQKEDQSEDEDLSVQYSSTQLDISAEALFEPSTQIEKLDHENMSQGMEVDAKIAEQIVPQSTAQSEMKAQANEEGTVSSTPSKIDDECQSTASQSMIYETESTSPEKSVNASVQDAMPTESSESMGLNVENMNPTQIITDCDEMQCAVNTVNAVQSTPVCDSNDEIESVQQDTTKIEAEESENVDVHVDDDEEIPATQIESCTDSIVSTPVCDSKLTVESTSVRSTRRMQSYFGIGTPTNRRTPRKLNASIAMGTPTNSKTPSAQLEKTINYEKNSELLLVSSSTIKELGGENTAEQLPHEDVFSTPARIDKVVKCNSTATRSTCRNQTILDQQTDVSEFTAKTMKTDRVEDEPQKRGFENVETTSSGCETSVQNENIVPHDEMTEKIPATQIESEDSVVSTPVCDPKLAVESTTVRSTICKPSNLEIGPPTIRQTPQKLNVSVAVDTPCKMDPLPSEIEKIEECEIDGVKADSIAEYMNSEEIQLHITHEEMVEKHDEIESVPKDAVDMADAIAGEEQQETEQNDNAEVNEIPATQIESKNSVCSTPVCDSELAVGSTSVGSARRNQPLLDIATPNNRRTPRELNASVAVDIPSEMKTRQIEVTHLIDDEKIIVAPLESLSSVPDSKCEQANESTFKANTDEGMASTSSDIDTKARLTVNSTAPRSTRRNRLILEMQTFTPKFTPRNLDIIFTKDTSEKQEIGGKEASEVNVGLLLESASNDEQHKENIIDMDEEMSTTQIKNDIAVLTTPPHEDSAVARASSCERQCIEQSPQKFSCDEQSSSAIVSENNAKMEIEATIEPINDQVEDVGDEQSNSTCSTQNKIAEEGYGSDMSLNKSMQQKESQSEDGELNVQYLPTQLDMSAEASSEPSTQFEIFNQENTTHGMETDSKVAEHIFPLLTPQSELKAQANEESTVSSTPTKINEECQSIALQLMTHETESTSPGKLVSTFVQEAKPPSEAMGSNVENNDPTQNDNEIAVQQQQQSHEIIADSDEMQCDANKIDTGLIEIDTINSVQSTPVCDSKLAVESTNVRSTRRKQPLLNFGTPSNRRTPRKRNASVTLNTPIELKTPSAQFKKVEESETDGVEASSVDKHIEPTESQLQIAQEEMVQKNDEIESVPKDAVDIVDAIASEEKAETEQNVNADANEDIRSTQIESEDSVLSTPVCDSKLAVESTSVRSTRRKHPLLNFGTPSNRRTPRKRNASVTLNTPIELKTPSAQFKKVEGRETDDVEASSVDKHIEPTESQLQIAQEEMVQENDEIESVPQDVVDIVDAIASDEQRETKQNDNAEVNEEIPDIEREISVLSTPVCDSKLAVESTSVRSTRRKPPHLEIGTPINRRTPRKLNAGAAVDTPGKLEVPSAQSKKQEKIVVGSVKSTENVAVEKKLSESNVVENENIEPQQSIDPVIDGIEAQNVETDAIEEPNKSDESLTDVESDVQIVNPERKKIVSPKEASSITPNVKIIMNRIGTPEIRKLTQEYIKVPTNSDESNSVDRKTIKSAENRNSKSTSRTTNREQHIHEAEASTSDKCDAIDSLDSSSSKPISETIESGSKRVGTPLPSNRKIGYRKNEKAAETESTNEAIDDKRDTESVEAKSENSVGVTKKTDRPSRQKKVENDAITSTQKVETGTPLTKRRRNVGAVSVADVNEESTKDNPHEVANSENQSDDAQKSMAPVLKNSRRQRANIAAEKLTSESKSITPNPIKSHLDHVNDEKTATPGSSRSLRNRGVVTDESSAATPQRTRKQRKASQSDDKPTKKTDDVTKSSEALSNKVQTEQSENVEKPKRQGRRNAKANSTAAANEQPKENVVVQPEEVKQIKRTAKRTRAQSVDTQKAVEKVQPPSVSENESQQMNEEKEAKRASKRTKNKHAEDQIDSKKAPVIDQENAPSTSKIGAESAIDKNLKENQAAKKPKRDRAKKVETEKVDTAVVSVAASQVITNKRTLRSASVCSDTVQKTATPKQNTEPTTSKVPEKKRRLRDRTASTFMDNAPKPSASDEPSKSKYKAKGNAAIVPDEKAETVNQPEKKVPKRGVKRPANDDTDAVAQTPPKKRDLRLRSRTVSIENLSTVVETAKPKAKRGRKAEVNVVVEVDKESSPPPAKRSRNTKKTTTTTKDTEVESKSNTKESKTDKKETKKPTESSDANAIETPPISTRTRTRQRK